MKWAELIQDENGKISRTGVVFLAWIAFIMLMIAFIIVNSKEMKLPDIPDAYVYMSALFAGTYTVRRFFSQKFQSKKEESYK